jgi:serine/threonine-protein kinase
LNHPGITRLLDAGHTASGQPYLVMEYVDGVPIDIYCKHFAFEAKIVLFLAVCEAVAANRLRISIETWSSIAI